MQVIKQAKPPWLDIFLFLIDASSLKNLLELYDNQNSGVFYILTSVWALHTPNTS